MKGSFDIRLPSLSAVLLCFLCLFLQANVCESKYNIRGSIPVEKEVNQRDSNFNTATGVVDDTTDAVRHSLDVSSVIPPLNDTVELGHLSSMVYGFRGPRHSHYNCSSFSKIYETYLNQFKPSVFIHGNSTLKCHMYECDEDDTQVLIVSKSETSKVVGSKKEKTGYIAVVYAGTDDFRTVLVDTDILTKTFGPVDENGTHPFVPNDDIRVHAGFNNAVFNGGLYDRIRKVVNDIKLDNPGYRLLTTGHSLGAADSVLTAVAFKLQQEWKDEEISSINFGCPKTGNWAWKNFVNSMEGLSVWRVVNGLDLVPRLPGIRFHHVGHTMQMDGSMARAFWLHDGDKELGYRGVPLGWNTLPYVLSPAAAYEHLISHYNRYLEERSMRDEATFYVDSFERINGSSIDENDDDAVTPNDVDDQINIWNGFPNDDVTGEQLDQQRTFALEYASKYLDIVHGSVDETDTIFPSEFQTETL